MYLMWGWLHFPQQWFIARTHTHPFGVGGTGTQGLIFARPKLLYHSALNPTLRPTSTANISISGCLVLLPVRHPDVSDPCHLKKMQVSPTGLIFMTASKWGPEDCEREFRLIVGGLTNMLKAQLYTVGQEQLRFFFFLIILSSYQLEKL